MSAVLQPRSEAARRMAEARARVLTLAIAGQAKWQVRDAVLDLPPPGADYLYVLPAHLLLIPTTAGVEFAQRQAEGAIRAARSDALIISRSSAGTISLALGFWRRGATEWPEGLAPWLGTDGSLWLAIPSITTSPMAYPLAAGPLKATPAPWRSARAFNAGLVRAVAWLGSF